MVYAPISGSSPPLPKSATLLLYKSTPEMNVIDPKILNDLAQKISNLMPADLTVLKQDVEKNIRALLQGTFQKLDLVTREEFDVQTALLARTREKLEALEKRLQEWEKSI
ncbi:MAG TPA: accessory factor UbiK family protein [Gammaproteobacteria bacterium]|nr:accessory factor UbiK family protein [Gammaproteobacteria bacterium]